MRRQIVSSVFQTFRLKTTPLETIHESILLITQPLLVSPLIFHVRLQPRRDLAGPMVIDGTEHKAVGRIPNQRKGNEAECCAERDRICRGVLRAVELGSNNTGEVAEPVYADDQDSLSGCWRLLLEWILSSLLNCWAYLGCYR